MKNQKEYIYSSALLFSLFFLNIYPILDLETQKKADSLFTQTAIKEAFLQRDIPKLQKAGFTLYPTWQYGRSIIAEHPSLQGWLIKGDKQSIYGGRNLARLDYADFLRSLIAKYKCDRIKVVEEYPYHIPGKKQTFNENNFLILSKKIDLCQEKLENPNDPLITQLKRIIKKAGYWDVRKENIFFVKNNGVINAIFIDTEPFPTYKTWLWSMVRSIVGKMGVHSFKQMIRQAKN